MIPGALRSAGYLACLAIALVSCQSVRVVPNAHPGDRPYWDFILDQGRPASFSPTVRGAIIPHHMVDELFIASTWNGLAKARPQPPVIVLLSPDHFLGNRQAQAIFPGAGDQFDSLYGTVPVARELILRLTDGRDFVADDEPFLIDHGVFVHIPFVAHDFPGVPVLPILLKQTMDQGTLDRLVAKLGKELPDGALVVASVDFSHYNAVEVSQFHDKATNSAVQNLDAQRILKAEVDSPQALSVLLRLMQKFGATQPVFLRRTDLQSSFSYRIADNTSHSHFVFQSPDTSFDARPRRNLSLLVTGVAPAGTLPDTVLDQWSWDWRQPEATDQRWPWLVDLKGEEDRFFMGSDLYLFNLPPGSVIDRTLSGVNVRIATTPLGKAAVDLKAGVDLLIVVDDQVEGGSYPAADFVIHRGGKIVATTTSEREAFLPPLLADGTNNDGRTSTVLGLTWTEGTLELTPFPVSYVHNRPKLRDLPLRKSWTPTTFTGERE